MNGKKRTLFGVLATAGAASIFYGLYKAGVIKKEHVTRLYKEVKQSIAKVKIISAARAAPKVRDRLSKK